MGENVFDFFGGMANLPDDEGGEELDLSGLDSTGEESSKKESDESGTSGEMESYAGKERADAAEQEALEQEPTRPGQGEDSHWLDLASSLGVAIGSTEFEQQATGKSGATGRASSAKKPPRATPKPSRPKSADDDAGFGRGLLEDVPPSEEESRQKQLLSELFVPTGEAFETPSGEVRQVDDVEIVDDEMIEDELDEELMDVDVVDEDIIDDEMVEFEVEELSSGEDQGRSEFSRRSPPPRENTPRQRESSERSEPRESEGRRDRPRQEDREDRPPRRSRRDRGRGRPGSDRPAPPEKKVRSQVLPADEDFIIDPLDDDVSNEVDETRPEAAGTKSIKFPTWLEAVSPIIEANIARRGKSKSRPRRPQGRGGD